MKNLLMILFFILIIGFSIVGYTQSISNSEKNINQNESTSPTTMTVQSIY